MPAKSVLRTDEHHPASATLRARRRLPAFHIVATMLFLCIAVCHYDRETGFTRYICFGDRFAGTRLPEAVAAHPFVFHDLDGYDGQFYAQIALSPFLTAPKLAAALDQPDYRARRIGLPWLAWLAGVGRPAWILQTYALANVAAWLALAALLLRWIPPTNATARLAWFGGLFGAGALMSVERALTDLPATVFIAAAIVLGEHGRRLGAYAAFALAALTRETSALSALALLPGRHGTRAAWASAAALALLSLAPLAAWWLYVHLRFVATPLSGGGNFAPPFVAMFAAIGAGAQAVSAEDRIAFVLQLLTMAGLCVQFVFLAACAPRRWREPWWRAGVGFALLLAVLGPAVWQDAAAAARAVLPMTLAFNILLPRDRPWSFALCAAGNLSVLLGVASSLLAVWHAIV